PLIVVYAGYASPDVLLQVAGFAYVIVYDYQTFNPKLAKLLDDLHLAQVPRESKPQTLQSEPKVDVQKFEQLVETRRAEQQRIDDEIHRAVQTGAGDHAVQLRNARAEWGQERSVIEDRIRAVRADRTAAQNEQLRRYRDAAEKDNRRRVVIMF